MKVVQERLGHSSFAVTADIYSHVAPDLQEQAAGLFGAALRGGPEPRLTSRLTSHRKRAAAAQPAKQTESPSSAPPQYIRTPAVRLFLPTVEWREHVSNAIGSRVTIGSVWRQNRKSAVVTSCR
jgi:hypothetical protein